MATSLNRFAEPAFAELHCLSNYSFLRGASHPEELIATAAALGYSAIAITDECSFAGLAKAHMAAKEHNIKLIIGSEFQLEEGIKLIVLAPHRAAYGQLSALITKLRRRSEKGTYRATIEDFRWGLGDCLFLWPAGAACATEDVRMSGKPLDAARQLHQRADIEHLLAQGRALQQALTRPSPAQEHLSKHLSKQSRACG